MKQLRIFFYLTLLCFCAAFALSCNYVTHRTLSNEIVIDEEDPEPDYNISLDRNYQDFVTYIFMGNRSEAFGAFFNKFYQAEEDYEAGLLDYRTTTIATYNRRLDSLNITPPVSQTAQDFFKKVIERCSKIIQYNKNTRFLDEAVLLVGKSYYYMGEYLQADRKFNEFFSKLTKSSQTDEALLFLGRTKIKLGQNSDGEKILKNLLATTKNLELKSEITEVLAFNSISKNDFPEAINYFGQSINFTSDKEKIAEKQYILAKIYSTFDAEKAYNEYLKVIEKTSDFDLTFYARLNVAKSLNILKKYKSAYDLLVKLNHSYRDYPEYKQLIELELANTLYYQKNYADAKKHYFDIIIDYAGTKSAADAYYYLGEYSEKVEKNYLDAYINFKKASETNNNSDYNAYSAKRAATFDKYYTLVAIIKDTVKITLPTENKELETYKFKLEQERGTEKKKIEEKQQEKGGVLPPKGGGEKSFYDPIDSLKEFGSDTLKLNEGENVRPNIKIKTKTDTTKVLTKNPVDTSKLSNIKDTLKIINEDSLKAAQEKKTTDSLLTEFRKQDSIKIVKEKARFDAYFQLSELFLYDLNNIDSTLYYLNIFISTCPDSNLVSKALFAIANIYKSQNKKDDANEIYKKIISNYPNSIFANESRIILGLPLVDIQIDSSDVAYKRIEDAIAGSNFQNALNGLKEFVIKYPESARHAKALFTIGWIYEYMYSNKDSSISYYEKLKQNYPYSEYTSSVLPKLEFYASLNKPDSTKSAIDTSSMRLDSNKIFDGQNFDSLKILNDTTLIKQDSINNAPGNKNDKLNNGDEQNQNPNKQEKSNPNEETKPKGFIASINKFNLYF